MTVEVRPTEPVAEPREKTVADVLRHAARIIEERGLNKDGGYELNGAVCALGSINVALTGDPFDDFTNSGYAAPLYEHIEHITGEYDVIGWNDAPERTAAEVTAALRAAADKWEADR